MSRVLPLLAALAATSANAEPNEWLDGTVLSDCAYCKTDDFRAERRRLANQAGPKHDPASGMGYVVTLEPSRYVWGRAALVGTGNLIRTDAHVFFADTGVFKSRDGKIYFEPMHHGGANDRIEIDRSAVQRGGPLSHLETDVKNDWAIARLREDAIEKFDRERVFAFLWDLRVTHDEIVKREYAHVSTLVLSPEHTFAIDESCESVTDDHPSRYAFGVDEVFFVRCPSEFLQAGSSGSALAILSPDGVWNLGGQIVAGAPDPLGQQLLLGNAPMLEQTLTIVYLQELIRRGIDPRRR